VDNSWWLKIHLHIITLNNSVLSSAGLLSGICETKFKSLICLTYHILKVCALILNTFNRIIAELSSKGAAGGHLVKTPPQSMANFTFRSIAEVRDSGQSLVQLCCENFKG